ncbi:MAG: hypothetical protein IIV23_09810 [Ruminococcus sp.]|nr:hypothetical protein [Ruminococcus sp.]
MREILFRGKTYNDKWVQGLLVQMDDHLTQIRKLGSDGIGYYDYSIVPSTVGQYTGLTDKNGKKIFEGDVLNVHDQIPMFDGYDTDEIVYNGKVMYIKNQGMFVCEGNNDGNALCALNLDKCEVIGNIYDNPELLEVAK